MAMTKSEGRWFRGDGEESPSLGLLGANTDCVATSRNSPGMMALEAEEVSEASLGP